MNRSSRLRTKDAMWLALLFAQGLALFLLFQPSFIEASVNHADATNSASVRPRISNFVLLGWNDLGMHCMNENFANLAVLPPFNTLWAQVVQRGSPPQIITNSVTVEYRILNNTFSACQASNCKSNFWQYAQPLFGLASPLPDNIGLTGATLSGTMSASTSHFVIVGVPVTPYRDNPLPYNPSNWYPYQQAYMVAKSSGTGTVLIDTTTVAPVSTEMRCDSCHADGKDPGGNTGNVETNILTLHDDDSGTSLMTQRPVLCAKCHASNALGTVGVTGVKNLSLSMHEHHADATNDCYLCHPGQVTRCLRDIMWSKGLTCITCHGNMLAVANPNRNPWVDLPRCGDCHTTQFAENANTRYRDSVGHSGMYCEACHGSPHAILPTVQANDNIQSIAYQGYPGVIRNCSVCHATTPQGAGPHGITAQRNLFLPLVTK
ncbi:MAG: hypothetical protein HZB51_09245 [Chloroflexi bacterium]|nr:hypothetical protein [Chloroflexota bacterium]